jgi:hypothetical protein
MHFAGVGFRDDDGISNHTIPQFFARSTQVDGSTCTLLQIGHPAPELIVWGMTRHSWEHDKQRMSRLVELFDGISSHSRFPDFARCIQISGLMRLLDALVA